MLRVAHGDISFLVSSEPLPSPAFRLVSSVVGVIISSSHGSEMSEHAHWMVPSEGREAGGGGGGGWRGESCGCCYGDSFVLGVSNEIHFFSNWAHYIR